MDWNRLIKLEDDLRELEREADGAHRDGLDWYSFGKLIEHDLHHLVGFGAKRPGLRSMRCVRAVHRHLTSVRATDLAPPPTLPSLAELERLSHATTLARGYSIVCQ